MTQESYRIDKERDRFRDPDIRMWLAQGLVVDVIHDRMQTPVIATR